MGIYRVRSTLILILCIALAVYFAIISQAGARDLLRIGTANVTGVYYPTGGAICRLFNTEIQSHGMKCVVEVTGGSVDNLKALQSGKVDMAIVQSDLQYNTLKGKGVFAGMTPNEDLRAVFSLYSEPFTVVASEKSGIRDFSGLKGRRVNFGNHGSGMRATMQTLIHSYGWDGGDFKKIGEIKAADQAEALCSGKIDAIIYMSGHPNNNIRQVTSLCKTRILNVQGKAVEQLIKSNPFYSHVTIPAGMYANNDDAVETFGVKATLVTSNRVEKDAIYTLVQAVFSHLDDFKTLHPVFAALNKLDMAGTGNAAPLHEGALKYYKDEALLSKAK